MSDRPRLRMLSLARMGLITTSLVGSMALGGGSLVALAQDASPAASPAGDCVPGEMSTGMATPADLASPVAAESAGATPADDATTSEAEAFVANVKACINNADAIATLVTPNLVKELGDYDSIDAAKADGFFSDLPFGNATTGAVNTYDDGSVGIVMNYNQTEYQYISEEWLLVQENGALKLNDINQGLPVSVDGDQAAVGINLNENADGTYAIAPNADSVVATDVLIFQAINTATNKEAHELVVVKLPEGMDPMAVLDPATDFSKIEFIGQVSVPIPGESVDMTLVNLPPGTYELLCFFPGPDGSPHAAHGMMASFEVTAPEGGTPTS